MRNLKLAEWLPPLVILTVALASTACDTAVQADYEVGDLAPRNLAIVQPEEVGMSSERLERLSSAMQELVDDGKLAGITTAIARHGRIAHFGTFGSQDIEKDQPMGEDTIFRIYSMTKPITGVALMMLYEEGKFRLSDPVARHIPEFRDLKVAAGNGQVVDADHPMTMRELMSHSGGLTYGFFSQGEVDDMYAEANVLDTDSTLENMIQKLSKIPLRQQPSSMWHYSVSVDVQGYLVEKFSGMRFDEFLQQRILEPLGMKDTGFYVPEESADRFAQVYVTDEEGKLTVQEGGLGYRDYFTPPKFLSGGGGLVASTMDYLRFCQMILNGGELDGVRILSPLTVDLMRRNQLHRDLVEMAPGTGFGLDFAVVLDPVAADGVSKGEFYWSGLAGTWFWIDPVEDLVFVGMIQQMGRRPDIRSLSHRLTYQAILEPAG